MASPPHDALPAAPAAVVVQTRINDGLGDRLENLASKLEGMGFGQLPPGNVNNLLKALERPVRGGGKFIAFQRAPAAAHPDRTRHNSDILKRPSVVQHSPTAHGGGHVGGFPSATNVHGAPPRARTSTASLAGRGNEDPTGGAASPNATGGLAAIVKSQPGTASGAGDLSAPNSARRRAKASTSSAAAKTHPGLVITQRPPQGSLGVPRDEPAKVFNSYMEMTVESKQKVAEAVRRYQQVKADMNGAIWKIQSDKRDAFAALEKERKHTLNGGGARKRINKQANSLVGWSAERAAEAVTQRKEAHKKAEPKPPSQAASLTYVEHRNRTGSASGRTLKRPDSVDVAAQLILGEQMEKVEGVDEPYDADALARAQELIQAAEIDRKASGGAP